MTRPAETAVVVCSITAFCAVLALAQGGPEAFTAIASVKRGTVEATTDLKVDIHRYATDDERAALIKAAREGGMGALHNTLATMADAGSIQLGERSTPIKFAARRQTPEGQVLTVITATPIVFVGAGLPSAKTTSGFDVAIAILVIKHGPSGVGELAPAAKIGIDDSGAVVIEDYGDTVVWLNRLVQTR